MSLIAVFNVRAVRTLTLTLLTLAACCSAYADTAPAVRESVEQRLQAIEDEKEIRELLVRYGRHLDALELAEFSMLFAREGSWAGASSNFLPVKGPKAIEAMLRKTYEGRVYDPRNISNVHVMTNATIIVKGDRASGLSRWTVITRNDKGEPFGRQLGRYEDEYVREDGRWKFLSRVVHREIP